MWYLLNSSTRTVTVWEVLFLATEETFWQEFRECFRQPMVGPLSDSIRTNSKLKQEKTFLKQILPELKQTCTSLAGLLRWVSLASTPHSGEESVYGRMSNGLSHTNNERAAHPHQSCEESVMISTMWFSQLFGYCNYLRLSCNHSILCSWRRCSTVGLICVYGYIC